MVQMQKDAIPYLAGTNYEFVQELGTGQFGIVLLVKSKSSGKLYAAKFIPRDKVNKYVERETLALRQLWHPHVVVFKEAFTTGA